MNAESMIPRTFRRTSHDLDIANEDLGYFENLSGLYEWPGFLGEWRCDGAAKTKDRGSTNGASRISRFHVAQSPLEPYVNSNVPHSKSMMAKDHRHRPKTAKLWSPFRNIVPEWCRDCDPRHGDVWRPMAAV